MTRAEKTIPLPRAKDLKSNKLKDIQDHLQIVYDAIDKAYRLTFQDIAILKPGTAAGQVLFWDGFRWVNTETSELYWDDVNKTFGMNTSSPDSGSKLHVAGTIVGTRSLMGGVLP